MDYAREKMEEYQNLALEALNEFPESKYRDALRDLVVFTTRRNK